MKNHFYGGMSQSCRSMDDLLFNLRQKLATERDAFGKKETEMLSEIKSAKALAGARKEGLRIKDARIAELEKALKSIIVIGTSDCEELSLEAQEAKQALSGAEEKK